MTKIFEKGDIVKIAKTSRYYDEDARPLSSNPTCNGVVQSQGQEPTPTVSVRWDNGNVNQYAIRDLEYATPEEQLEENPIRYTVLDLDGNPITFDTKEEAKAYQYKISKPYIEPKVGYKQINFMGATLSVIDSHKWVAIDNNGEVFSFSRKPIYDLSDGYWFLGALTGSHSSTDLEYDKIGTLKCAPKNFDYNKSLTEI